MEISKVSFDSTSANLQYWTVPTPSQLDVFLVKDQTNTIQYNEEKFVCKDFAEKLALNAREEKYQMNVLWLFGHVTETHEQWSHALNQMVTTQGLVTIEPQNDMWWYANQREIRVGDDFLFWYFDPPINVHIDRIECRELP
jgi:hypothetical protein